jgi:cytochrome oxidase Cu insertion factor (SCO1/SenC/PrrC family)
MARAASVRTRGLLLAAAVSTILASCGGQAVAGAGPTAAARNPGIDLGSNLGAVPAPDFTLTNQFGQPVSLHQFRGDVVLLAFVDSECTTICPLTTVSMTEAKSLLGNAGQRVQLLGIDANPEATAVANVQAYSLAHGILHQWDFLTGSLPRLEAVWKAYHVEVRIEEGAIDHTPALFVIDPRGREQKVYLTQMAYASIGQQAEILAREASQLLPGHPSVRSIQSLASIPGIGPGTSVSLPAVTTGVHPRSVRLGPGRPELIVFFATWLTETSDLVGQMEQLNAYQATASARHLPALVAVDETTTEPTPTALSDFLRSLPHPLAYPVAEDTEGRVADGYGVQDQPWFDLVSARGTIVWHHDGWVPLSQLEQEAAGS